MKDMVVLVCVVIGFVFGVFVSQLHFQSTLVNLGCGAYSEETGKFYYIDRSKPDEEH